MTKLLETFGRYLGSLLLAGTFVGSVTSGAPATAPQGQPASESSANSTVVELLELSGVFVAAADTSKVALTQLPAANPSMPEAVWKRFAALMTDHETISSLYAPVYTRYLSTEEIQGMIEFYRSPLGTRYREAMPAVREETQTAAKAYVASVMVDLAHAEEKAPPPAADPDTRRLAVHTLLRESGALERAVAAMQAMIGRLRQRADPDSAAGLLDAAQRRLTDEQALLDMWTPAYIHHFSGADIQSLIAFFRSPVGSQYVKALPAIQKESVAAATTLGNQAVRRAVREVLGPLPQWKLQHPDAKNAPPR